ncbi:hypothetical protein OHA37_31585 [Streptomyces sp. NBC_00335]|uniref:hypothetical protein n=1 Tax=unclassified Streptomyces TaxID=2593676 RepID=UPI00224F62BC|nr:MULTISPECIES: hypothetical protein [unclassified Streptomyces]MCX5408395.1 hypothetical protein [Streptomyces sp. NBC_00086]
MLQLVLVLAVFVMNAAVYGPLALRWRRRARIRREILRLVAGLDLGPYHVAAMAHGQAVAAAAELLLDGYLGIDGEGAVLLTEAGRDPARTPSHPLPAALLEAVRRHDPEPVSIGWIDRNDEAYGARRTAHRAELDALLPELPRMPQDEERGCLRGCCGCVGLILLMVCWMVVGELLVFSRPHGPVQWASAAVTALGLMSLCYAEAARRAVLTRTECGDPLGDRMRAEVHPAVAALDEEQRVHVHRSADDYGRWRGADRVVSEDGDDGGAWGDGDDWWEDAYHYRASDEPADDSGTRPSSG